MHADGRTPQSAFEGQELPIDEPLPVQVGELVGGKYRVERMIGVGGMGVVVAAVHVELGESIALKVMRASRKTPETVDRFLREARAVVRLKSTHVAKVRDVGTLPNGLPYMAMDLLEGSDLFAVVQERGPLPVGDAIDFILQACDALSEAHAVGIIHRDLKPENLFLTSRRDGAPHVRVLDFGISKVVAVGGEIPKQPSGRPVTQESTVMGSPNYMSPEQIRSPHTVDERTDIWALGCTLYELLTNEEAFSAESAPDIMVRVLEKAPPPLAQKRPDLPPGLVEVIERCLQKNREDRFESIDAFASALSTFSPKRSTSMPPQWRDFVEEESAPVSSRMVSPPRKDPPRKAMATMVLPHRAQSRRRRMVVGLAALAFFVSAGGAVLLFRDSLFGASPRVTTSGPAATLEPAPGGEPASSGALPTTEAPVATASAAVPNETATSPGAGASAAIAPVSSPPAASSSLASSASSASLASRRPVAPVTSPRPSPKAATGAVTGPASPAPTSLRRTDW